jgi:hypothetical protein
MINENWVQRRGYVKGKALSACSGVGMQARGGESGNGNFLVMSGSCRYLPHRLYIGLPLSARAVFNIA